MAKKPTQESTDLSKVSVKLKPFLGMQPGLYLTVLYALILLLIIFLVLFLPGIIHWGSNLEVSSKPAGAAIFVDGKYVGATPRQVFVTGGVHELTVKKPFYSSVDNKINVGGRLVGSLFAPRRENFSYQLELTDLPGLLSYTFKQYSKWALVDRMLPNYQMPPILKDAVGGALSSANFSGRAALWKLLESSLGDVNNPYLLSDFTAAVTALAGPGSASTPQKLLATLDQQLKLGGGYPNLPLWLAHSLPKPERQSFEASPAYTQARAAYLKRLAAFTPTTATGGGATTSVDGMQFTFVPGGHYIMGASVGELPKSVDVSMTELPHIVQVPGYYMLDTEVTHAEFARFVAQNPEWAPGAVSTLSSKGLATSDYLKGWATARGPNYPQAYVSYFAAKAFCDWLTKQLPPSMAGYTVRLPSAAEWEWAARMKVAPDKSVFHEYDMSVQPAGTGAPNSYGIRDLLGNVWEWTSSWYLPTAPYLTSPNGRLALGASLVGGAAEMNVRGGSFASSKDSVSYTTRASQPPDWCTPYLGFRPIIVKG